MKEALTGPAWSNCPAVVRIPLPVDEPPHMKYFEEKTEIFSPRHADMFVGWSVWGQGVPPVPDQLVLSVTFSVVRTRHLHPDTRLANSH